MRNKQRAIQELRVANFGEASVDQHTGIEQFGRLRWRQRMTRHQVADFFQVHSASFFGADHEAQIGKGKQGGVLEKGLCGSRLGGVSDDESDQQRGKQSHHCSESTT